MLHIYLWMKMNLLRKNQYTQSIRVRGKANEGYRPDLDKNFRSSMEANVYRYLTWCHPDLKLVEVEPHLFTQEDGLPKGQNVLPDFRCTTHEGYQFYIEVCPYIDNYHRNKVGLVRKYCGIDIQILDGKIYEKIKKGFSKGIPGWE
jgi:hypothetical protein